MSAPDLLEYLVSEVSRRDSYNYKGESFDFSDLDLKNFSLGSPATTSFVLSRNKSYKLGFSNEQLFYIIKNTPVHINLKEEDWRKTELYKYTNLCREILSRDYLDSLSDTFMLILNYNHTQNINLTQEQWFYVFNQSDLKKLYEKDTNIFLHILKQYNEEHLSVITQEQLDTIYKYYIDREKQELFQLGNPTMATYYLFYKAIKSFPSDLLSKAMIKEIISTANLEKDMNFYIENKFVQEVFTIREDKDSFIKILRSIKDPLNYPQIQAYIEKEKLNKTIDSKYGKNFINKI